MEPKQHSPLCGVLCVNKPEGFTSFDVIAVLRGILHMKKIGHGGTLDPMATGVLPVFLGCATRAIDFVSGRDKSYLATIRFGLRTDTLDRTGETLERIQPVFNRIQLEEALTPFRGEIWQMPPMYSAVQVGGKRLYDLARRGEEVEREKRKITIYDLSLVSFDQEQYSCTLQVRCSKGTYIRTLADDLGKALGCGAVLWALERTESLGYALQQCHTLEEIKLTVCQEQVERIIHPVETLFADLPRLSLNSTQAFMFQNGVRLDTERIQGIAQDGLYSIWEEERFLGLGEADLAMRELKVRRLFVQR